MRLVRRTAESRHAAIDANPFLRFREHLDSYAPIREGALSDGDFVDLVRRLDDRVANVWGHGFVQTPVFEAPELAEAVGLDVTLYVKDETGNVSGSHKARHLFGTALRLLVEEPDDERPLAIASCGNAALAAAVIAKAMDRRLEVFVPDWADESIVDELCRLDASVTICPRRETESGDPAYLRFRERLSTGAIAFGVQAVDTPSAFDGGRTLGWELDEQVPGLEALYVQVGGGALGTSVSRGAPGARLYPVQAEGCAPLRRAWDLLEPSFEFDRARAEPSRFMWAWEPTPTSIAEGILDDVTHDWIPLLEQTRVTDGEPVVVPESTILHAYQAARTHTEADVSPTGSAGLAGAMHHPPDIGASTAVIFTGRERSAPDTP